MGDIHEVPQGEVGEQGDAMMPMLYFLGPHRALLSAQSKLLAHERLLAFLDDIYVDSQPERTFEVHAILRAELCEHSRIRVNEGKIQIWNRGGFTPSGHKALLEAARVDDPDAQGWFGDHDAPAESRGTRASWTPLGTEEFVRAQLRTTGESHQPVALGPHPRSAGPPKFVVVPALLRHLAFDVLSPSLPIRLLGHACRTTGQSGLEVPLNLAGSVPTSFHV